MDDIVSFGAWVQQRRKALDLTQADLAEHIGCAVVTIKKIEQDERRPSRQMANLLAKHLLIPSLERDAFLRRARGQFVPVSSSSAKAIHLPAFLKSGDLAIQQPSIPFVGRERELAQLEAHLNPVLAGDGRVVFITGEAGEGKTALMAEFARRVQAAQPDLIVAGGNCNAFAGVGDPYLPFRDVFGLLTGDLEARWAAGALSAEQSNRLWRLLPQTIQALAEHGPNLMDVLVSTAALTERIATHGPAGADWLDSLQLLIEAPRLANLEQRQLFEQITLVLRALAVGQPLLLLLDDLQWADNASLNLLFHLGRRLHGSRVLILGAYRASEVDLGGSEDRPRHLLEEVVNEFKRRLGNIQLDLEQFVPAEEQAFVDALLDSEPNRLGPAFRETLFWHTKGHPLFTIELLRDMQERGNLVQDEAGRWVEDTALNWNTLPVRVEAVIKQRIDRLSPSLQELLTIASVEGERFTAQVVAQAQPKDERYVLRQLAQELGRRHRLVREYEEVKVGSHYLTRFQFGHALFQQYLYRRLSQGDRARAERHYHQALAILEQGPESVELARAVSGISQMHMLASAYDQAIAWGRRALALAERLAAEDVIIHALNNIGAASMRSRDWEQGRAMLQESLHRALTVGLPHDACRAYVNLGEGLGWMGRYAEARSTLEELLAYATRVQATAFVGVALVRLGELE